MRSGATWRFVFAMLVVLSVVGHSCTESRNAGYYGYDALDGILDVLDVGPGHAVLPASGDPTITITDPATHTYFELGTPVTPVTITVSVTNWAPYPEAGKSVICYVDGEEAGSTESEVFLVPDVSVGLHYVTCRLALNGTPLTNCEATTTIVVKVEMPCDGFDDSDCIDGNPCSIDACVYTTDGYKCHYGTDLELPYCCVSKYNCDCEDDMWDYCSDVTNNCSECKTDEHYDDDNACTDDSCDVAADKCANDWIYTDNGKCCDPQNADPDGQCDDGHVCTTDACNLAGMYCTNTDVDSDPPCCETDPSDKCDDDNVCTIDKCINFECRHGPVWDDLCCNDDSACDDSNPCTDDSCDGSNQCEYTANGSEDCCTQHIDCSTGGDWDDGEPSTIDYCLSNQCVHTLNPQYCECVTGCDFPVEDDGEECTTESCDNNVKKHTPIDGCCTDATDCDDGEYCTTDTCVADQCVNTEKDDCCTTDEYCKDDNPCNIDVCINYICRYGPDWTLPDCCIVDSTCNDGIDCTTEYCNTDTYECVRSLVPDQDPECCWSNVDCNDANPYTVDSCNSDKECAYVTSVACNLANPNCNDSNTCTTDECDYEVEQCKFTAIKDCCVKDTDCDDEDGCTSDSCNLADNECVHTEADQCCTSAADCGDGGEWDDGNDCTTDTCIGGSCKHVKSNGCCTEATKETDCNDGITCSTDACTDNLCVHTADYSNEDLECCNSADDCVNTDPCMVHQCVNYECVHTAQADCCEVATEASDCEDSNPCTCDKCVYGKCRHLGPDQAPASCGLPGSCCVTSDDCESSADPCITVACTDAVCTPTVESNCAKDLPYTQTFNSTSSLSTLSWSQVERGNSAAGNWKRVSAGDLGPDNHERFDWTPQTVDFDSFIVTPPLDSSDETTVTVQYERNLDLFTGSVDLGTYVIVDLDADGPSASDTFIALSDATATDDIEAEQLQAVVSEANLSDHLYVGFRVAGSDTYNVNHFDIDNVKVCGGVSPKWISYPTVAAVEYNDSYSKALVVKDADEGAALTWSIVSGPSFATLSDIEYYYATKNFQGYLKLNPTGIDDVGSYDVTIRVSDGCLTQDVTLTAQVVAATGYLVWDPSEVPSAHAAALAASIKANDRTAQIVDDYTVFEDLSGFTGIFIAAGVYGGCHVLTNADAYYLGSYLNEGGKIYLEGGDVWAHDSWTNLQPYFQITGLADGSQTYAGPVNGRHFCDGQNFTVSTDYTVNNFIDRIDKKVQTLAKPIITDTSGDFHLGVAFEHATKKYRTIGVSVPFTAMVAAEGTLDGIMARYIDFFENGYPACVADTFCNDSVPCTADTCDGGVCENAQIDNCTVCVNDSDCDDYYACNMKNHLCAAIPYDADIGVYASADTPKTIGSATANTVTSTISVTHGAPVKDVHAKVFLKHYYRGDLKITLTHGAGSVELVSADATDTKANFYHTYDDFLAVDIGDMDDFDGDSMNGNWTLTVEDTSALNGGQLVKWELYLKAEVDDCEVDSDCDDELFCTVDTCNTEFEYCEYKERDCGDSSKCTTDSCDDTADECVNTLTVDCDDGNECTTDFCVAASGTCQNTMVDSCDAPCTTHADCGANDYCHPVGKVCTLIPGDVHQVLDATVFPASIPDNSPTDLTSTITLSAPGKQIQNVYVKVLITHTYKGDLTVSLGNGTTTVYLHNQSGGAADNLYAVYDLVESPDGAVDLSGFDGQQADETTWTLTIHDWATGDSGKLVDWRLFIAKVVCTADVQCDDDNACTIDTCDENGLCNYAELPCDDGAWCNGEEICASDTGCSAGIPQLVDDGIGCTADYCDEVSQTVKHVAQDGLCDDGAWCNGSETCDEVQGCMPGTPEDLDDGNPCTIDTCDEQGHVVQHTASDVLCDDDLFCNGTETCHVTLGCQAGAAPDADDSIACTVDSCDEDNDVFVHAVENSACNDGLFCNGAEICDTELGCVSGATPLLSDGLSCTVDACDEGADVVTHVANDSLCNDDLYCNGEESCDPDAGCVSGTPPSLTDGIACTVDECVEVDDSITHTPSHSLCVYDGPKSAACLTPTCDSDFGCIFSNDDVASCEDGIFCTIDDYCDGGYCQTGEPNPHPDCACESDDDCEQPANLCNGVMECKDLICQPKADSVVYCEEHAEDCLKNTCNPDTGICEEGPKEAGAACDDGNLCTSGDLCDGGGACAAGVSPCNDGYFCNGEESCDPDTGDCIDGDAPVLSDDVGCTMDICDEENDVVTHTANDNYCDDLTFCNGPEYCDEVEGCKHAGLELDDTFDCTTDSCDEENDIVLHIPVNALCNDGLYCTGTETCSKVEGCVHSNVPVVDDGIACTVDVCSEDSQTVTHTANHSFCSDNDDCNGTEVCNVNLDCQDGVAPALDDGIECTLDSCTNGDLKHTPQNSECDDGKWCNGTETCSKVAGCVSGTAPTLDDNVACTQDYCNETLDTVVHQVNDGACDNGQYCDGTEYCDDALGCTDGTVPDCDDDSACTLDECNDELNGGLGACDSSNKVQYCTSSCGGEHSYDAGDNDCGYDDACVGGLAGDGMGTCTPICSSASCGVGSSGVINTPINDYQCVTKTVAVTAPNAYILDLDVRVELLHSNIGDIAITLTDPEGTEVDLWAKGTGGTADNFYNTFTTSYEDIPGALCSLQGHAASGTWSLKVCDTTTNNEGLLRSWGVYVASTSDNLSTGDTCASPIAIDSSDGTKEIAGTTVCASDAYGSSCGGGGAADRVYSFTLDKAKRVVFSVEAQYDAIIALKNQKAGTCNTTTMICKDSCSEVGCAEQFSKILKDVGTYYFFVDGADGEQGTYTVNATFATLKANGEACEASIECISTHCNNGYCCDVGGVCCSGDAVTCPAEYNAGKVCDDTATCQGHAVIAACTDYACSSSSQDDDGGCDGEIALGCGCYDAVTCTEDQDQSVVTAADCPDECTDNDDTQCDESCHCSGEPLDPIGACVSDFPDGDACVENSDCISNECQGGFCCSAEGESACCTLDEDCPIEDAEAATCDNTNTCQGHRVDSMCVNSICGGVPIDDDTACSLGMLADDCGFFLSVYCPGGLDQTPPECRSDCLTDGLDDNELCDPGAHCDTVCLADVANGGECDEESDCISDYCSNGYCCDGPGDCCSGDGETCPADYFETPSCDSPSTCQGSQVGAVCLDFMCVGATIGNDSECGPDLLANTCGYYKDIICDGTKDQDGSGCPDSCTLDAECDASAHCDDICLPDLPNGEVCDEASDCISSHCQNGFCCDSGDCCAEASNCPESYYEAPSCSDAENCQGTRLDKRCEGFICSNEPIDDDSGCTTETVAKECGCYSPAYCNSEEIQGAPDCATGCDTDDDCSDACHCDDTCVTDLPLGSGCDENSDCASGFCADGVCCNEACDKACESCNQADVEGTCTSFVHSIDPEDDCGLCSVCNGASGCVLVADGLDPLNECPANDENTCLNDGTCDGAGACAQWVKGTVCGTDSCILTTKYKADICDGDGACVDGGTTTCVPYYCDDDGIDCDSSCTSDDDCVSGYWCNAAGACVAKQNDGAECSSDLAFDAVGDGSSQCLSDYCIDGYCCNMACEGSCAACNVAGLEGTCSYHAPQSDPEGDCGECSVCNGTGSCTPAAGGTDPKDECTATDAETCGFDGTCDGVSACRKHLQGTVCADGSCEVLNDGMEDFENGTKVCDGSGLCTDKGLTICYPYVCNGDLACYTTCFTDSECAPDSWCNGATCIIKKDNGETCSGPSAGNECKSDFCVDGVCCENACTDDCKACNLTDNEGTCTGHPEQTDPEGDCGTCLVCGADSSCVAALVDSDPKSDCSVEEQSTCGANGYCNGAGSCDQWVLGTVCVAQTCDVDVLHLADTCDGGGVCDDGGTESCEPYVCNDEALDCLDSCTDHDDCVSGYYCDDNGVCVPTKDPGDTCNESIECTSGFCVDGYCCNTPCSETCYTCIPKDDVDPGDCHIVDVGVDPDGDCNACMVCDENAECVNADSGMDTKDDCEDEGVATCGMNGVCDGAGGCAVYDADLTCAPQSCVESTKHLIDICDGAGVCEDGGTADCSPYMCDADELDCLLSCTEDTECVASYWCDTFDQKDNECKEKYDNGTGCILGNQCKSSFCVDGVCCDKACDGTCSTCDQADSIGECVYFSNDTDPDAECELCGVCNGSGECKAATLGTDPKGECEQGDEIDCGFNGECDGAYACQFWGDETECVAQTCVDHVLYPADACSGDGSCADSGEEDCSPYMCNDIEQCRTLCFENAHCVPGYWCDNNNECSYKKPNGYSCAIDGECISGSCVDGYCCDDSCDGTCTTCSGTWAAPLTVTVDGSLADWDLKAHKLGTGAAGVKYYMTWDASFIYVAVDGVNLGTDKLYIAFDEALAPDQGQGSTAAFGGMTFDGGHTPDYAIAFVAADEIYYVPHDGAGAWDAAQPVGDSWSHYAGWAGNKTSEVAIPRTYLGSLAPATGFSMYLWANNNAEAFIWSSWPDAIGTGGAPLSATTAQFVRGGTGMCVNHVETIDPEFECGLCKVCDGTGACSNAGVGLDEKDDCTASAESDCGFNGGCDGFGSCEYWDETTICVEQTCIGYTLYPDDFCDAAGSCINTASEFCVAYVCNEAGDDCLTSCGDDDDCQTVFYCLGNTCTPKKDNGETCIASNECLSDHCVDGYCCDTSCENGCEACNVADSEGACTFHSLNSDPEDDCPLCEVCSGNNNDCVVVGAGEDPTNDCEAASETTCDYDGTCDGASACRDWISGTVCLDQYCSTATVHWNDTCDGDGTCDDGGSATCEPYVCDGDELACLEACGSNDDCFIGYYCDVDNTCVPKKDLGEECGVGYECLSTFCVDGVCCDTACDDGCSSCDQVDAEGMCSYHLNDSDPEDECGLCGVCNGNGSCKAAAPGVDPKEECAESSTATCGLNGNCDGNYACQLWDDTTPCLDQSCTGIFKDPEHLCDGVGSCIDLPDVDCVPYVCNEEGSDCLFTCAVQVDCQPLYYCEGQICLDKKENGETCSDGFECLSDECVDGYCCNNACEDSCQSCGLGGFEGACTGYDFGTDPEAECGLCNMCDGNSGCIPVLVGEDPFGHCEVLDPADCQDDGTCDGAGACRLWIDGTVCLDQFCESAIEYAPDLCNGDGLCIDQGFTECEPYVCDGDDISCRTHCTMQAHCYENYYCDGNDCLPKKDNGETCNDEFECLSDECVDGYCCDTSCEAGCHTCALDGFIGACTAIPANTDPEDECVLCEVCDGDVTCVPVEAGDDPEDDCAEDPVATCDDDGTCDGASACRLWIPDSICLPQYCENGVEHSNDLCDGIGECIDQGNGTCTPYVCDDAAVDCLEMCTETDDCVGTHWCDAPNCVLKKVIGSPCNADVECASDYCVDGVCCNNQCDGDCENCNIEGQGGICSFHGNMTDPEDDCGTCKLCNGAGSCNPTLSGFDSKDDCQYFASATCQLNGYCDGLGDCAFWDETTICEIQACTGSTLTNTDYCDGDGVCLETGSESCCPYTCGNGTDACRNSCSTDDHCCVGNYCHGASCIAKKVDGGPCANGNECSSGFCVDGFCCNEACDGDCRSCSTAGSEGTCTNHTSNSDPEFECGLCRVCNGAGGCKSALIGTDEKSQCAQSLEQSCGLNGTCDGAGACDFWNTATVCVDQVCNGTDLSHADMCDGWGACDDNGTDSCCPYACDAAGSSCRTGCSEDFHCCTDSYCNSGSCEQRKAQGETCDAHNQCLTGFCVDGYCCDGPCQLGCESCSLEDKEGTCSYHTSLTDPENDCTPCWVCTGINNECTQVGDGADPVNDCSAMAQTSCGYDGYCDGSGACAYWDDGTECFSQYCVGGVVFYSDTCNGGGVCTDGGNDSCEGYACADNGSECRTACTEQYHCGFGFYCTVDGECVEKKDVGETCGLNVECASWYCVDGYCCNGPCGGQCQACDTAGLEGTCTNLTNNTDPENECGPCRVCSGGGACKDATQGSDPKANCAAMPEHGCGYDGDCSGGGACEYWDATTVCAAQSCTGSTLYETDQCNGAGVCLDSGTSSCSPYKCAADAVNCLGSCTSDADCIAGHYCAGAVCTPKKSNGQTCSATNECLSNYCVDGYCCNSGCAGSCRSCALAGSKGICTFYTNGTDPEVECADCKVCNGSGQCNDADEGTDPKDDCDQELPSTCGQDGACNGNAACRHWPGGTICSDQTCDTSTVAATKYCDGDGSCLASASDCGTLGWSIAEGSPFVCGESDTIDVNCSGLMTFAQAKLHCQSMGGRLCTWSELINDEAAGTGCGYGNARVWTISECGEGQYYTGAGEAANLGNFPQDCSDGSLAVGNVRCCADTSDCCPYMCDGKGCGSLCGGDDDCCDGYYCEQNQCKSKGDQGQTCMGDDECGTGFCVDGYCCDTACDGLCEGCALEGLQGTCSFHTNNTDPENSCLKCEVCDGSGACTPAAEGTDPANDCVQQAASTCGYDGLCDGASECRDWIAGTECSDKVCSDFTLYVPDECTGFGICFDSGTESCCPYKCNGTGTDCRESCTSSGQCCSDAYCDDAGSCSAKVANGTACSGPDACLSGFCVDGFCCNNACDGECSACNVNGSEGTCSNHANNDDVEEECGKCRTCNGAGACKSVAYGGDPKDDCAPQAMTGCGYDGTCDGNAQCSFWPNTSVCDDAICGGNTYFPADYCSGDGSCTESGSISCCPYQCNGVGLACRNSCAEHGDCCGDSYCLGSACVARKDNGQTCSIDAECTSSKCVDGYCCDTWCGGACQACNVAGEEGTCTEHTATTDPEGECGLCKVCNGTGSCVNVPNGADPLEECTQTGADTCGYDGSCDGGGGCRYWDGATVCLDQRCTAGLKLDTKFCNGSGSCSAGGASTNCCPYGCSGNECRTDCSSNTQCCANHFCVNGECKSTLPNGSACSAAGQCSSGFCVDGYCCDTACAGECAACNVDGALGVCTQHSPNTDPDNECATCLVCNGSGSCVNVANGQDPLADCIEQAPCNQDGYCDGVGACRVWNDSTECNAQTCSGSTLYLSDFCDGVGNCTDSGTTLCTPYKCSGNGCASNCADDNDCVVGYYCSASECIAKKSNGDSCGTNNQCLSGHCVDGVCCDTSCTGLCRACDIAGFAGTCSYFGNNADPDAECETCWACNGAGACKTATDGHDPKSECDQTTPTLCGTDGTCDGVGACRYWSIATQCGDQSCSGTQLAGIDYCNGAGACVDTPAASCCPYKCSDTSCKTSCSVDADCCGDAYCNGSACVAKLDNGEACSSAGQCTSGKCVDGYCCDSWCIDSCEGCNVGGALGVCTDRPQGTDPENECGTCEQCSGAGACEAVGVGEDPFGDCNQTAPESCGQSGACDGNGDCEAWDASTVCEAQKCVDTLVHLADYCSGDGQCLDSGSASCCPYRCSGDSCGASCSTTGDCCDAYYCSGATCISKLADGDSCTSAEQCASGHCVDGVCCNTGCAGECQACNKADFVGKCTYHSYLSDPEDDCGVCSVCNGSGNCMNAAVGTDPFSDCSQTDPDSCGLDGSCDGSGACRYWDASVICAGQSCDDETLQPTDYCDGVGACLDSGSISCCPYKCLGDACRTSCSADVNCCEAALCKAAAACQTCSKASPCPISLTQGGANWCCDGDSCNEIIELTDPLTWLAPTNATSYYKGSTYGNSNQFEYAGTSSAYGSYAPDRVYHFDTKNDNVGVQLKAEVWGTFTTVMYLKTTQCGGNGQNLAHATNNFTKDGISGGSTFTLKLKPGMDYYLYIDGYGTQKGDYNLNMTFTSLCENCSCDSSYGENTSNSDECLEDADMCSRYTDIVLSSKPSMKYYNHNLGGDRNDFNHWGSYDTYYNCSDHNCLSGQIASCSNPPARHGSSDKVYRLVLATASNVIIRVQRTTGWSSGYNPRFYVWQGDTCPGTSKKKVCLSNGNSWLQWGDGGCGSTCGSTPGHPPSGYGYPSQGVKSFAAGTYWIIVDVWQGYGSTGGTIGSGKYKLSVTVW